MSAPAERQRFAAQQSNVTPLGKQGEAELAARIDAAERDNLLRDHAQKIEASGMSPWLKTQSAATVRSFLQHLSEGASVPGSVAASRGGLQGTELAARDGLKGAELEAFKVRYGSKYLGTPRVLGPQILPNGTLRVVGTAWEWKKWKRAQGR